MSVCKRSVGVILGFDGNICEITDTLLVFVTFRLFFFCSA